MLARISQEISAKISSLYRKTDQKVRDKTKPARSPILLQTLGGPKC
jgi:hypothetical protein